MMNKYTVFAMNTKVPFGEPGHSDVSSEISTAVASYLPASTVFRETIGLNRRESRKGVSTGRKVVGIEFRREFFFFQQRAKKKNYRIRQASSSYNLCRDL
jgi:hypothetical protein